MTFLVLMQAGSASAQERQPTWLQTFADEAGVLTPDERRRLSAFLRQARERTGVPIIMVVASTTGKERIHDYGERLARRWRDERGVDPARAVLIIVAMDKRQLQILPGRSLRLREALHREDPTAPASALFAEGRYFDGLMTLAAGVRIVVETNKAD